MMVRASLILLAIVSSFLFPYPFTLVLSFVASLFVPIIALGVGLLQDALFFAPHQGGIPVATVTGAILSILALVVRRFIKARIMS